RTLRALVRLIEPRERGPRVAGRHPGWKVAGNPRTLVDTYEQLVAVLRRRDRPLPDVWGATPPRTDFTGYAPVEIARRLIARSRGLTPTSGHETVKRLVREARRLI